LDQAAQGLHSIVTAKIGERSNRAECFAFAAIGTCRCGLPNLIVIHTLSIVTFTLASDATTLPQNHFWSTEEGAVQCRD
jgi:hypothetical protein